ncbi:hypothetical protein Vadar_003823 [Vaccinium darrowii]|uniref:Uncharacterized protein n=1 Tax=Vaccinium darrowii TaxID=229202 RepID=A0ACB7YJ44_9ERIC|nr:hypothetical protein Vadar_003823 [Vaccinium darrowii]
MAGNDLPSLARVKRSDLIPSESLPSDLYKLSVSTLSQSLAQYSAAIIQLCPADAALLRASLNLLVYTSIKDHHALLWI